MHQTRWEFLAQKVRLFQWLMSYSGVMKMADSFNSLIFYAAYLFQSLNLLLISSLSASGEPPQCMSCAALFALKQAMASARLELGNKDHFMTGKCLIMMKSHEGAFHLFVQVGLVQERHNSSVLAMELRLSCTNPPTWGCNSPVYSSVWFFSRKCFV